MTTNAQAALHAAATVFAGSKRYATPEHVTILASHFNTWLTKQDALLQAAKPKPFVYELPLTRPEPSDARPGPGHFLTENANADPVCRCGWNPAELYIGLSHREDARQVIREHIAAQKPNLMDPVAEGAPHGG